MSQNSPNSITDVVSITAVNEAFTAVADAYGERTLPNILDFDEYTACYIAQYLVYNPADVCALRLACKSFAKNIPISFIQFQTPERNLHRAVYGMYANGDPRSAMISPEELSAIIADYRVARICNEVRFRVFRHMTSAHMLVVAPFTSPPDSDHESEPVEYRDSEFKIDALRMIVKEDCSDVAIANIKKVFDIYGYGTDNEITNFVSMVAAAGNPAFSSQMKCNFIRHFARDHYYNKRQLYQIAAFICAKHCPELIFHRDPTIHKITTNYDILVSCPDIATVIRVIREFPTMIDTLFFMAGKTNQNAAFWLAIRDEIGEDMFVQNILANLSVFIEALLHNCEPAFNKLVRAAIDVTADVSTRYPLIICTPTDLDTMLANRVIRTDAVLRGITHVPTITLFRHICALGIINASNCTICFTDMFTHYQEMLCMGANPSVHMRILADMYPSQIRQKIAWILAKPTRLFSKWCDQAWVSEMCGVLRSL